MSCLDPIKNRPSYKPGASLGPLLVASNCSLWAHQRRFFSKHSGGQAGDLSVRMPPVPTTSPSRRWRPEPQLGQRTSSGIPVSGSRKGAVGGFLEDEDTSARHLAVAHAGCKRLSGARGFNTLNTKDVLSFTGALDTEHAMRHRMPLRGMARGMLFAMRSGQLWHIPFGFEMSPPFGDLMVVAQKAD